MDAATTYDEWKSAAIAHDKSTKLTRWKSDDKSEQFDFTSIRRRLRRLRRLRRNKDYAGVLYALNEGVHGNIDGMGRAALYRKARFGTKKLIVDYVDEVSRALELLASPEAECIPQKERLDFFRRAQHCNGCSALMMSGAGSLLFFHIGVRAAAAVLLLAVWPAHIRTPNWRGSSTPKTWFTKSKRIKHCFGISLH